MTGVRGAAVFADAEGRPERSPEIKKTCFTAETQSTQRKPENLSHPQIAQIAQIVKR